MQDNKQVHAAFQGSNLTSDISVKGAVFDINSCIFIG